jgi:hypothetical protein
MHMAPEALEVFVAGTCPGMENMDEIQYSQMDFRFGMRGINADKPTHHGCRRSIGGRKNRDGAKREAPESFVVDQSAN